ncbi:class I SAM-dependent methyltransferase [Antarcticimicrobium luteum]|uniref:Class I SAM-dependent methyltransferase n=1 Tax=Antarcticimicrobium luteum TaxID=2547397 RepID=A0A4R5V4A4_9RHOB|nr:class I SAM-dependent methyltransferase [Antarcticimicrobium luteum]TDK46748.1 class I SAM-dependent methyltransferase [Antarcticimicrobium luteum]
MSDPKTIAIYDDRAAEYAGMTDQYNTTDPRLVAFIAACPEGGRVLDLGCGPGAAAARMAEAGLAVDAVDASAAMVEMAARHPGVTARHATFDDIAGEALYDGIWANFSLLHAPRTDFPRHLSGLHRALKPGGVFLIGLKLGKGEARDRIGRLYTYYTEDDLMDYLRAAGFTPTDIKHGQGEGLDGTVSPWISVIAHG